MSTGSAVAEVITPAPSAALAAEAEAEALDRPVTVVVLIAMMLVTTDAPEPPTAELKRVEMGAEAESNKVETGLDDRKLAMVEKPPDEVVIEAPPTDCTLVETSKTSVVDDPPTGGGLGPFVGAESMLMDIIDAVCGACVS